MACMTKILIRSAVIGGLGIGLLALVAGPDRLGALFRQTQDQINKKIDDQITDPVALRTQLRDLEGQYPKKIAAVRSDLSEVRAQLTALKREKDVSQRVVELAEADLNTLRNLVARAEEARTQYASLSDDSRAKQIEISFQNKVLTVDEAYTRAQDVNNTRAAYGSRVSDIDRDLGYLVTQEQRLASMLTKLEGERQDFQVQLWSLDRQVDSIARNDRMIDMLSKRQKSIDEHSRYKAASLDHITTRVSDIRARQEGELASLNTGDARSDYESRAKMTMDRESAKGSLRTIQTKTEKPKDVIRINAKPGDEKAPPPPAVEKSDPADTKKPGTTAEGSTNPAPRAGA